MEITAELVKTLRNKTDAGMMDCKKALKETDGDLEAAVAYLRQKGRPWPRNGPTGLLPKARFGPLSPRTRSPASS